MRNDDTARAGLHGRASLALLTAAAFGVACGDDAPASRAPIEVPQTYTFESRLLPGVSSVAYTGQTKRHALILAMKDYIGGLTDQSFPDPEPGEVAEALRFFHEFATAGGAGEDPIGIDPGVAPALQTTWADLGSLTTLTEKMPENDGHELGGLLGYGDGSMEPEQVLFDLFARLDALIVARAGGNVPVDPSGAEIPQPYVDGTGVDYLQVIQKYLTGAIALSQAADDYLDDDVPGKGLLGDNTELVEGEAYTTLEHLWDEGFGYFGAPRNYGDYSDDEAAAAGGRDDFQGANDANGDGFIDLESEYVFGHAQNAAKRDRGSAASAPTDFSQDAFDAFLAGRTLIVNADGALDDAQLDELRAHRDQALLAWERAIAATAVHYVNDTLQDMGRFGTPEYDFADHAKHWSELYGFALALQFDVRHRPISDQDLLELYTLIGSAPVLPNADPAAIDDYRAGLVRVKSLLGDAYGFAPENLGDEQGQGGW